MKSYKLVCGESTEELDVLNPPVSSRSGISVIIATLNEEGCLPELVTQLVLVLEQVTRFSNYEIIVVDDDSKDQTPMIMDAFAKNGKFLAIHRYGKRNLFSAIRDGISMASYSKVLTMDADLSHRPVELKKNIKLLKKIHFLLKDLLCFKNFILFHFFCDKNSIPYLKC